MSNYERVSNGHSSVGTFNPWAPVQPKMGCSACGMGEDDSLTHEGTHASTDPMDPSTYAVAQKSSGMWFPLLLGLGVVAMFVATLRK